MWRTLRKIEFMRTTAHPRAPPIGSGSLELDLVLTIILIVGIRIYQSFRLNLTGWVIYQQLLISIILTAKKGTR